MGKTKETSKKDILGIISIINIIALFVFSRLRRYYGFLFVSICIFILIEYIMIPFKKEKEENPESKRLVLKVFLKSLVSFVFIICLYRILLTKNYNLKYTYYIGVLSFIIMWLYLPYNSLLKAYKKDRKEEKKTLNIKFIGNITFNILVAAFIPYLIFVGFIIPTERMILSNIKEAESISMVKITKDYYDTSPESFFDREEIYIDSLEDIEKIEKDLQGQEIENLSGVDLINYERMTDDYRDQYQLQFIYEESEGPEILEEGYIHFIKITSNEKAFIEQINFNDDLKIFSGNHMLNYPVELSEGTMDTINSYKSKLK